MPTHAQQPGSQLLRSVVHRYAMRHFKPCSASTTAGTNTTANSITTTPAAAVNAAAAPARGADREVGDAGGGGGALCVGDLRVGDLVLEESGGDQPDPLQTVELLRLEEQVERRLGTCTWHVHAHAQCSCVSVLVC